MNDLTTIAYKDGVLAADTRMTYGDGSTVRVKKIFQLSDGSLFGVAGESPWVERMREWAISGFPKKRRWSKEAEVEAMHIKTDGSIWLVHNDLNLDKVEEKYYAIGSGGAYAIGAMDCGKGAAAAVKIACRRDSSTSEPIDTLSIGESK